ncbi:MarR family winged helix-turn-helix transcriptional regulator [Roseospira goensis]|uniref:DNA-binding MarR family transcriptional regulator n=1 Tax=Roseospira goensis TaxID=391922 RepID=A0A7W6S1I2_9PROT|nr:MarR family transcriptional regulator [Roseospira goensis]MBB4287180.1 DNA-binding MarR family transcriptional regulator [Roseospira goensis]
MSAFDKTQSAGYLANHLARLFAQGLHRRIRPLGLAPAQFMTLLELWAEDGLTQKQLLERLDVEQATMANTLARMERDGLVVRTPHPQDARAQQVWLTDAARALQAPATDAAQAQNRQALAGLSAAEQGQFLDLMRRVLATMRAGDGGRA